MKARVSTPKKPKTPPITIKRGPVKVMIYTVRNGEHYVRYSVVYREADGTRKLRHFSDPEEAKREAELVATRLANGQTDIFGLRNADVAELLSAREALAPFNITVTQAVNDHVAVLKRLPPDTTLFEAVNCFAKRHPANAPKKTVQEVVAEFIADRQSGGCSPVHLRDLNCRLARFARAFQMQLQSVTAPMVQEFIAKLTNENSGEPSAARSKENALRQIASLFNYARRMKYIAADLAMDIAEIPAPKKTHVAIEIYTPDEIARLLAEADDDVKPALAIASFAGLRLAEVARLDWSEVKLGESSIVVEANKAKTAARRIVPVSENLAAWLAPLARPFGPVNPCEDDPLGNALGDRFGRAATRAKVEWKRNGLRHSYISYRVAVFKDVPAVALECGNSPSIIFANYRALATEKEARAWFAVAPAQDAKNIIPAILTA